MANREFEFKSQTWVQKFWLYAVRVILIWMIGTSLYTLSTTNPDLSAALRFSGGAFIVIWAYANVVQAKTEIQELFVPPFQLYHAQECMIIGAILTTASWFV